LLADFAGSDSLELFMPFDRNYLLRDPEHWPICNFKITEGNTYWFKEKVKGMKTGQPVLGVYQKYKQPSGKSSEPYSKQIQTSSL
jgi:hypothetical protein